MNAHLNRKGQKIVFIHGKGEGVLRRALINDLTYRYKKCTYQDASFQEYGYGLNHGHHQLLNASKMEYGYIKVASAVPLVSVANCNENVKNIETLIAQAEGQGVEIIVFPELCLTGYTCQDLFRQHVLLDAAEVAVMKLLEFTNQLDIIAIVGAPVAVGDLLLNCAIVIQKGHVLGIVPKTYLPNYSEFYEKRWFASAQDLRPCTFHFAGHSVSITSSPQALPHHGRRDLWHRDL